VGGQLRKNALVGLDSGIFIKHSSVHARTF